MIRSPRSGDDDSMTVLSPAGLPSSGPEPSAAPAVDPAYDPATWRGTRALIRSDFARICTHMGHGGSWVHRLYYALLPGFQALFWYRLSRCCYLKGWTGPARFISLFAIYLTRSELPPTTAIGHSALIAHPTAVYVFGRIGARLTIQGEGGFGGGFGEEDIGGGPGYAVAGDDVTLAFGARVLGPVQIGHGVRVGPGALVTFDVPDHGLVMWDRPRVIQGGARPTPAAP